jgi:hypothetical protein
MSFLRNPRNYVLGGTLRPYNDIKVGDWIYNERVLCGWEIVVESDEHEALPFCTAPASDLSCEGWISRDEVDEHCSFHD